MTDERRNVETRPEVEAPENGEEPKDAAKAKRRGLGRRILLVLVVLCLVAGAIVSIRWVVWRIGHATTDAAYVKADIADVAPQVAGRIVAVEAREGQTVHRGDVLLRIDPDRYDRQVAEAEAALAQARAARDRVAKKLELATRQVPAAITAAEAGLESARTKVVRATAARERLERQYHRFERLLEKRAIPRSRYEQVETAWKSAVADEEAARAGVAVAEARLGEARAARAQIGEAKAGVTEAERAVARAEEGVRMARLARSWCDITAPLDGVVARILAEVGDFASPGRPVIGLYDPRTRYVEARFEETKLRYIHDGEEVALRIDALPGKRFTGHVVLTAPASAAEFALIPRDITAGEFTKVTQRVPVRIRIDDVDEYPEIVPGLSVEVAVAR